jgi:(R,R)-butanediol dehydrogenase/meso-butanediol dehydrogenase/diacetyl reductase
MRAAVYHGAHDVRIEELPRPRPAAGEVLLRVLRSGMCGTDATEWKAGPRTFPVTYEHPVTGHHGPMVPGHEFIGEVVEPGAGAATPAGTVVATGAGVSCGQCDRCRQRRTNLCRSYYTLGLNTAGGMAEFVAVPESTLMAVPAGLSVDAAALAQPLAVGLHAARRSGAGDGDRVVLIGAGAIGTFVLTGLRHLADVDLTVLDFPGPRLERAARLGATRIVAAGPGVADRTREVVGGPGADVVIEASGAPGQLDTAIGLTRPGGTVLQVGIPAGAQEIDVHTLVFREIGIRTTLAHVCGEDLAPALEILAGTPLARELLEGVHPLGALADQLERLASGRLDGKVLFDPSLEG